MVRTAKNLIFFKLGWIATILFAAKGQPLLSILAVAAVVALHLPGLAAKRKELLFISCALGIGAIWESTLVTLGLVDFPNHESTWIAPAWIIAMWALFATTINHGMSWSKKSWIVAALAGGIAAPMAFYAGAKMGAVVFPDPVISLTVIGIGWAILMPVLTLIAETIIDSTFLEPGYEQAKASPSMRLAAQVQTMVHSGDVTR